MAFTVSEMQRIISATTIDRLTKMTIMNSLVDRRWQEEAQNTYEITVPIFTSQKNPDASITVDTPARNADWGDATEDALEEEVLSPDVQHEAQRFVNWRDGTELPLDVLTQSSGIMARALAVKMDDDMYAQFIAGVPAGQVTAGADANTISAAGASAGKGAESVFDAITAWELHAYDTGFGPDADAPFLRWMVMPPPVFVAFRRYLLDKNYADALNLEMLRSGNILTPGAMRAARAFLNDTVVMVSGRIPKHTSSGDTDWQILAGTNRALTYITKPALVQAFSPEENQVSSKPGWLFRTRLPFGRKMIDDRMAAIYRVRQA